MTGKGNPQIPFFQGQGGLTQWLHKLDESHWLPYAPYAEQYAPQFEYGYGPPDQL